MPVELEPISDKTILVRLTDESATNAFDPEFMSELDLKLRQIIDDEKIHSFILTGTEKFFVLALTLMNLENIMIKEQLENGLNK